MSSWDFPLRGNLRRYSGYTLIELMVVMMIMVLLFSLGFANYRDFQRRKQVESVARQIKSDLELIRSKALSGEKSDAGCDTLNGYSLTTNASGYNLHMRCDAADDSYLVKQVNLSQTGTTVNICGPPIYFNVLGRGISSSIYICTCQGVEVTQTGTSDTACVGVTETGEITIQ